MEEIWKPIDGYEGLYEVSNFGRVKSLPRVCNNVRTMGRILKPIFVKDGYYRVCLCKKSVVKQRKIHRLVLETFIGKRPKNMVARHLDSNKLNNNLINLTWGTYAENEQDKKIVNKDNAGENNGQSKLTYQEVMAIRALEQKHKVLAELFNISQGTISDIKRRRSWKHV